MYTEIEIPEPLASVMYSCAVCDTACCGSDAFDIHPQWIRKWLEDHNPALLVVAQQQMEEIVRLVSDTPGDYSFPLFWDWGSSDALLPVLNEWKTAIEQAPNTPLPPPPPVETPYSRFWGQVTEKLLLLGCGVLGAASIVAVIALIYWLLGRL